VRNTKWLKNGKLRRAILSAFYNISQRNFGVLLILWCSFKLWWNFSLDLSISKFCSLGNRSILRVSSPIPYRSVTPEFRYPYPLYVCLAQELLCFDLATIACQREKSVSPVRRVSYLYTHSQIESFLLPSVYFYIPSKIKQYTTWGIGKYMTRQCIPGKLHQAFLFWVLLIAIFLITFAKSTTFGPKVVHFSARNTAILKIC
jgi:hypothetical protein